MARYVLWLGSEIYLQDVRDRHRDTDDAREPVREHAREKVATFPVNRDTERLHVIR